MELPLHQIDAFVDGPFSGNPAAVMPLPSWLDDAMLQALAEENNLSETAFYTPALPGEPYQLRWFTPGAEVDLCGHATLATAAQLFDDVHPEAPRLDFATRSGLLSVTRDGDGLVLDLPLDEPRPATPDPELLAALGVTPVRTLRGAFDEVVVLASAAQVRDVAPNLLAFPPLPRGVIVTAAGSAGVDFVSRFFAPAVGVAEDPVTGSAHALLAPLWAAELGRSRLVARQLSARGGSLACEVVGDRVRLTGRCRRYLDGVVHLEEGVLTA
ncbi:MAG TPA: PhzF family phenazine biosynthesis protein [Aldersonia sp.]